jgi:hypothetical protein
MASKNEERKKSVAMARLFPLQTMAEKSLNGDMRQGPNDVCLSPRVYSTNL